MSTATPSRSSLFRAAWTAARRAATCWGGKAGQYFAECLRLAWAAARELATLAARIERAYAAADREALPSLQLQGLNRARDPEDRRAALVEVLCPMSPGFTAAVARRDRRLGRPTLSTGISGAGHAWAY